MTRQRALAEADAELSRCIQEGFGLFLIAELYGVPVRRHQSRYFPSIDSKHTNLPEWLQGQPGTLTWEYVRQAIADQVEVILEKEEAAASKIDAGQSQAHMQGLRQRTPGEGWNLGVVSVRPRGLPQRQVLANPSSLAKGRHISSRGLTYSVGRS